MTKADRIPEGLAPRVAVSTILFFGWISFVLLYAVFWSGVYTILESIVIIIVSLLLILGIMSAMWAPWGLKFAAQNGKLSEALEKQIEEKMNEHMDKHHSKKK